MDKIYLTVIEALIFASDEPIPASEIVKTIKDLDGEDIKITPSDIEATIDELNKKFSGTSIQQPEDSTFSQSREVAMENLKNQKYILQDLNLLYVRIFWVNEKDSNLNLL